MLRLQTYLTKNNIHYHTITTHNTLTNIESLLYKENCNKHDRTTRSSQWLSQLRSAQPLRRSRFFGFSMTRVMVTSSSSTIICFPGAGASQGLTWSGSGAVQGAGALQGTLLAAAGALSEECSVMNGMKSAKRAARGHGGGIITGGRGLRKPSACPKAADPLGTGTTSSLVVLRCRRLRFLSFLLRLRLRLRLPLSDLGMA